MSNDHKKIDVVIIADAPQSQPLPARRALSAEMQRAAAAEQVVVSAQAFDADGRLRPDALEVISEVMSHGGTVVVDLPLAARYADAFNAFATSVLASADAKAGHRNTGKLLFAGAVEAPLVTATPTAPSGYRRS